METTALRFEDFFDAMVGYRKKFGRTAATQLLQKVTGQTDFNKVHRSQYAEVIEATRSTRETPSESVANSAAWKKLQADCRNGHAKVLTGLKSNR